MTLPVKPLPLSLSPPGLARCPEETVPERMENKLERETEGSERNTTTRNGEESRLSPSTSPPTTPVQTSTSLISASLLEVSF
ncbi:hypothetical protein SESBI_36219 [Sesbania bispinosa]|nr:hypothetical protein SESBI_36219 [Sesbania bispinosa]